VNKNKVKSGSDAARRLNEISRVVSAVAHELRNPLMVISAAVFNIKIKSREPRIKSNLAHIESKIRESQKIINNLLSYARIKPACLEPVDLSAILKESVKEAAKRFKKSRVSVKMEISSIKKTTLRADLRQLKEIFRNILDNSYEACRGRKAVILIKAWKEGRRSIGLSFRDNGCGIAQDPPEKVFEPFFTTKENGRGLGLSLAKWMVELHGGEISAQNLPGAGAMVTVILPLND